MLFDQPVDDLPHRGLALEVVRRSGDEAVGHAEVAGAGGRYTGGTEAGGVLHGFVAQGVAFGGEDEGGG